MEAETQARMATEITSNLIRQVSIVTSDGTSMLEDSSIDGAVSATGSNDIDNRKTVEEINENLEKSLNTSTGSCSVVDGNVSGVVSGIGQTKNKRKHRRGKPKAKNSKPYKKTNWNFQKPQRYRTKSFGAGGIAGCVGAIAGGARINANNNGGRNNKLVRSRSLVPYNTNKFLMEEHLAEVPTALLTPSGRTRDSSFSIDSEDNYFYSLPEDEEEFLTKEFANVYEKARVERLETLTKQQLIEECLQIEDRFSAQNIGSQKQQQINVQNISAEFLGKIRYLEEKLSDAMRENLDLRRKLDMLPKSTEPMCSSSEDSESDSSSSSSSSCSSYSACSPRIEDDMITEQIVDAGEINEPLRRNGHHHSNLDLSTSNPSSPINGNLDLQEEEQQALLEANNSVE